MVRFIVKNENENEQIFESQPGLSLMEAMKANNIEGVVAECGGSMSCATCHVIVEGNWLTLTGEVSDMEDDMLDCTVTEREPASRLSCQIELSEKLDGIMVSIPEGQL